jgi:putative phosphoesterase
MDYMLVGIMSDSHGDTIATAQAVELLTERGAKKLFHCGDICGADVLSVLADHDCVFVWGNCDDPSGLEEYVAAIELPWPRPPIRIELAGKRIAVCHGYEKDFKIAADEPGVNYLFYGHTHRYADQHHGACRLINPGALHRAAIKTVATLDLRSDELKFWRIDTGRQIR